MASSEPSAAPHVEVEDLVRLRNSHRLAFVQRLAGASDDEEDELEDDGDQSDSSSITDVRGRLIRWVGGVPGVTEVLSGRGKKDKEGKKLISSYDDDDEDEDDDEDDVALAAAVATDAAADASAAAAPSSSSAPQSAGVQSTIEGGPVATGAHAHLHTNGTSTHELPEGHARILMVSSGDTMVRPVHHLTPVDRTFGPGQVVCWAPGAASDTANTKQSGIVESVSKDVVVRRVSSITPATAEVADPATCFEIPSHRLGFFSGIRAGDTVVRGSWVGVIDFFQEDVYVQFEDGAIACLPGHRKALQNVDRRTPDRKTRDPFSEGTYYPGQRVRSLPEVWKAMAQWIRGGYTGLDEGVVKSVSVGDVGVEWVAKSMYADTTGEDDSRPAHDQDRGVETVRFDNITLLESFRNLWWSVGDRGVLLKEEQSADNASPTPLEQDLKTTRVEDINVGASDCLGANGSREVVSEVAGTPGRFQKGSAAGKGALDGVDGSYLRENEDSSSLDNADDDDGGEIINIGDVSEGNVDDVDDGEGGDDDGDDDDEEGDWEEDDSGEYDEAGPSSEAAVVPLLSNKARAKRQGGRLMKAQRKARERGGGSSRVETMTDEAVANSTASPDDVVQVVATRSRVTVVWQDGTRSVDMCALNFRMNRHPDPYDFWPGEIVIKPDDALAGEDVDGDGGNGKLPKFDGPRKGALMSVNQDERTAIVRWQKEPTSMTYEVEDEVSVYELTTDVYEVSVGDTVLHVPQNQGRPSKLAHWVGVITKQHMGMSTVVWYGGSVSSVPVKELLYITGGDEDDSYESEVSTDAESLEAQAEAGSGERAGGIPQDDAYHHNWGTDDEGDPETAEESSTAEYGKSIIRTLLTSDDVGRPRRDFDEEVLSESIAAVSSVIAEEAKGQRFSAVDGTALLRRKICKTEQRILASLMTFRVLADACTRTLRRQSIGRSPAGSRTPLQPEAWERFIGVVQDAYGKVLQTEFDWLSEHAGPLTSARAVDEAPTLSSDEIHCRTNSAVTSANDSQDSKHSDAAPEDTVAVSRFDMVEEFHNFHSFPNVSSGSSFSPGFLSIMHKEWGRLRRHLPEGVLVRACESSADRIRAGIVGPADTPYEDAIFFFDIRMGSSYPISPPHVWFHSHGRRLNPNLYEDGKVCLSILGTWDGDDVESWDAKTSNLLRVLLSLQALVFVEEPYYNEAGYSKQRGTDEGRTNSRIYNESAYLNCIRHVIETLKQGGAPEDCRQVAAAHYRGSGPRILQRCRRLLEAAEENGEENGCASGAGVAVQSDERNVHRGYSSAGFRKSLSQLLRPLEYMLAKAQTAAET